MFRKNIQNSNSGTSLQSIMVGLALFGVASLLFIQVIKMYDKSSVAGRVRAELDASHSLAYQYLRQGLTQKITWGEHLTAQEEDCLNGVGVNCNQITPNPKPFITAANSTINPMLQHFEEKTQAATRAGTVDANNSSCAGASCGIDHVLEYKLVDCSSTKCDGLELTAVTSYSGSSRSFSSAPRSTSMKVAASTVLGTTPTMTKDCGGRVNSLNLAAQDLQCNNGKDETVCPALDPNNPLAISEGLAGDGSDCRQLATIACKDREALGLLSADDPECKEAPELQIFSAQEWITSPTNITFQGLLYTTEKCDVCDTSGAQECEKLEVRTCKDSTGALVPVSNCFLANTTFDEVLRYSQKFTKSCSSITGPGPTTGPTPSGSSTSSCSAAGRTENGKAKPGFACPNNGCTACKKCKADEVVSDNGKQCESKYVNVDCKKHMIRGVFVNGYDCHHGGRVKDIEVKTKKCTKWNNASTITPKCTRWSAPTWRKVKSKKATDKRLYIHMDAVLGNNGSPTPVDFGNQSLTDSNSRGIKE